MVKKKRRAVVRHIRVLDYSRLNVWKFGFALGKVCAVIVFLVTLAGFYKILGGFPMFNFLLIDAYGKLGFNISWGGAIIGAVYAFIDGLFFGALFAWLYNKVL